MNEFQEYLVWLESAFFQSPVTAPVFLPATKAQPKEMLPILTKPLIQYGVEEAAEAGLKDIVFVTGRNKRHRGSL